jgi:hypothetical protein
MRPSEEMIRWVEECDEQIAIGNSCDGCGRGWVEDILDHNDDCPLLEARRIVAAYDRNED